MKSTCAIVLTIALATSLAEQKIHAAAIQITGHDAFGMGRAEALVATPDNPSTIFYNPAGITQLPGQQVRFGVYGLTYQTDYRSPLGVETQSSREFEAIPQLYYTYSLSECPVSFGVGAFVPFGLSMKWPENTGFRSVALNADVTYFTLQPVVAWQIHRTFSIAAGPMLNYSQASLKQGLSPIANNDSFRFMGDAFAPGYTVAALWQPIESQSFGVTYRSSASLDYDGHTDTTSAVPRLALRQDASAEFDFPQNVTFGWSWRPTSQWNLEFDAQWMDWSSMDVIPIRQTTPVPPLKLNWISGWNFSWGVTRKLDNGYRVSGGYMFRENSVPDDHFTPLVPDSNRHSFAVGFGQETKKWSWDVAYELTRSVPRTVSGSAPSPAGQTADGRYDSWGNGFTVSAGRKF